jgi:hypothetical protein
LVDGGCAWQGPSGRCGHRIGTKQWEEIPEPGKRFWTSITGVAGQSSNPTRNVPAGQVHRQEEWGSARLKKSRRDVAGG